LQGKGKDSQIVNLKPHHAKLKQIKDYDLPEPDSPTKANFSPALIWKLIL
jgi:hypothetical protein